ncbi:hypothetical protein GLOTRDRAFT_120580 [Gloeophyllum trabeum ATCC 11539]|uniref:Pre-rRNA processing protein n=1 Tax=Gloeophyllum trabeum (strain ATCC 11539 / FP-39264 / Madison 617) TaxID=670483 RepID=S7QBN7_GLOTA|nr:uncharacterized protein GLOTRDRAFT_120580 [Gloeophyllum trabeum ATCC 11539]EPQ57376.1 hypothetical protein GLOTRDRAFT_120580 [Gloeophyllum trabeum ATCC 11539]
MEEVNRARISSGIFGAGQGNLGASTHSLGADSTAGLTAHVAPPAGVEDVPAIAPAAGASGQGSAGNAGYTGQGSATEQIATAPAQPKPPLYKRRWFIITNIVLSLLGIALLFILLFPVVAAIAQHVVNVSVLNIDKAAIQEPQNTSFTLALEGVVTHTGIFNAKIDFTKPIDVTWLDGGNEVPLGSMTMSGLSAKSKRAYINQTTTFNISDEDAFGKFAGAMITRENFTWRLESHDLKVQALKFPVSHGIKFKKEITLAGMNNFSDNVILKDLELPSDNPKGGINFATDTVLSNPSPFELTLGTIVFDLYYQDVYLGEGTGYNVEMTPGDNNIRLTGTLIPHNETNELNVVSQLFTNYLNGEASPVIAVGHTDIMTNGAPISWLTAGLRNLQLTVPFKSASGAISPIKAIDIGTFALAFTKDTSWSPLANSNSVKASMELPFGFDLSIGEIQNTFNITKNDSVVAGLSTPLGASTSAINVVNSSFTQGYINISIQDTHMECPDPSHPVFSQFNADLTDLYSSDFFLVGHARAVANMSVGQLTLDPIKFNVSSGLLGLQGLKGSTVINSVDVLGGTQDYISLGINVSIHNPSNLVLNTGDLTLQLFRDGGMVGTTLLPNLTLQMGDNNITAQGAFQPNKNSQGSQTLNDFVGKKDVRLQIAGFQESTQVQSLLQAFQTLNIDTTLPGLQTNLLESAALKVLNSTGRDNNISHVTVNLANPFTAGLDITQIKSSVSSYGINLGSIQTSTNFSSPGHTTTTSPSLDLNMNLDPPAIFTLTRALAVDAGLSTEQLDGIVELGGYQYVQTSPEAPASNSSSRRDNIYTNFSLPTFVDAAFKQLRSDVELTSVVNIGDYQTTLQYTQKGVPTVTDESLNLLLPILAQPIVQKLVTQSLLGIDTVLITDPKQNSFETKLSGSITNAGPFDANIVFGSGLTVSWSGKPLGSMKMPDVKLTGNVGAQLDLDATFEVADVDHLSDFTKVLLTEESFDWEIAGENLTVSAIGIDVPGINLTAKKVTLKGFNGLKNGVIIDSFDLPTNDPAGGIHLTVNSSVSNPSQVGIQLDSIGFDTYFGNTMLGPVAANSQFTLAAQSTSSLGLSGRLVPQTTSEGLQDVSTVFNNFIHGRDSPIVIQGDSAGPSGVSHHTFVEVGPNSHSTQVTWLNEGIKSLQVASVLPNQGDLEIIKSITLNQMTLLFSTDDAYAPTSGSNSTDAAFQIPFGFPIDITALEQNITVGYQGQDFAELVIPKGPSTTNVQTRVIHLGFQNVSFAAFDSQHETFNEFVASTTTSQTQTMRLSGNANTDAETAVGLLSLTGISFAVDTSLAGLQGLSTRPTVVESLDVNHGYPDYLLIKTTASLFNPSNLTIGTGDVSFSLIFENANVGTADVSDMTIIPGNATYAIDVHYAPQGDSVSAGQHLLENYIQGVESSTSIQGSMDSTSIDSLKLALSGILLSPVNIPALHQTLITSTSLTFPRDIAQTGIATASFTLANPFTASINLLEVTASAVYRDLTLGLIDHVDVSSSPIHADGHSNVTSPSLPFKFDLDPANIIRLLLYRSQDAGVSLGPLPDLFQIVLNNPDNHSSINATVDPNSSTCVSGSQFDVDGAVLNALKGMQVNLAVESSFKIDDFTTDLSFNQSNVPAITDATALYLIGVVAPPITQGLVDNAKLAFSEANITNLSDDGFDLSLKGSLTDIGPLDALITFTEPVTVSWEGRDIATISLQPICGAANTGVSDYETNAHLTITDQSTFTTFATQLLHTESFEWTISTDKLRVTALGTIFDNVSLSKTVSFKAFNNLPGVTISNFNLPSDDPAGGIHIETDSMIPSPSNLGIDLGTVGFQAYFGNDTLIGPLSGSNLYLAPQTTTTTHLSGRIIPQSGSDLDAIGELFSHFLAGDNQTLSVRGESVQPSGSSQPVGWLSQAFKTLELQVILPGKKYTIIESIALHDFGIVMTEDDQTWSPLASSNSTVAQYKNPFGFSLQVVQSAEDIMLSSGGTHVAELNLPRADTPSGVSTGNLVDLDISFHDQQFKSLDNGAFQALFAQVTDQSSASFTLEGTANVVARTTIGDIPISGIPFNVPSSLEGINGFGHQASLSNVSITGSGGDGGNQYIKSPLTTTLQNPSNVSLQTVNIALPVSYKGVSLGRAYISPFNLLPGENVVPTEFRYEPNDANDTVAQSFLSDFLQTGDTLPLSIKGDSSSTPFGSLQSALEGLEISTSLKGLNVPPIITHINVYIGLSTLFDNIVDINFDVSNPLDTPLVIEFVQDDSGVNGDIYAHFDQAFDSFVVPPHSTANSGTFGNVVLVKGALASLGIIPLGYLDVFSVATTLVGEGGYRIPWLHLTQKNVPTTYNLALSLDALQAAAKSIAVSGTAGSANHSSTVVSGSMSASSLTGGNVTSASKSGGSASASPSQTADSSSAPQSSASAVASPSQSPATQAKPSPAESPSNAPSPTPQPSSSQGGNLSPTLSPSKSDDTQSAR